MNTAETERTFEIRVEGPPTARLAGESRIEVEAASARMVPVRVRAMGGVTPPGTHRIEFVVSAVGTQAVVVREKSVFIVR
jgi:hypothetical protein